MFKLILLLCTLSCIDAYKILLLAQMPVRSLNILGEGYLRHLTNAGHEVTYISVYPPKNVPEKNFRHIDLSSTHMNLISQDDILNIGHLIRHPPAEHADIEYIQKMGLITAYTTFENEKVKKFLDDTSEHFDAVIIELFESDLYAALGPLYGCPVIWAYSMGPHWPALRLVDETTNPAYAMDYLTPDIPPFPTWGTRLLKFWTQIKWMFIKMTNIAHKERTFYEQYFEPLFAKRNKLLPTYEDVIYNASMVLSNEFPGNGLMPSVPQNFKFIGGYHIETPPKPLPQEIRTILDNAKHGFIYFSMGSTWKSKDIPKEVTKGLLDMFGTLKETVIWKYEEDLQNVPKNVHILKWAPQTSILAHPNILFFITHGGLLSSIESVHFGVPVIGVPIYFDQFININRGVQRGSALRVNLSMNLPKDLKVAIDTMVKDNTFQKRAEEISKIYHDRPVSPGAELVHWVEHVVRTRGAPHLRSPASLMPAWEKMFLDVIACIILISIVIVYSAKKAIKYLHFWG
ncbi:UDP-glucosyltransferase 2-like [Leguminivora glycinivorella]|uniref:UDP-glucosyltransferase 2-like n=1 Tax=Leguminivora glycinivorella TaxID=1035111 RepID=UPI0020105C7B|nr:UDP-glucosyltransferase 2-like [Leguminivora glycinivorella]